MGITLAASACSHRDDATPLVDPPTASSAEHAVYASVFDSITRDTIDGWAFDLVLVQPPRGYPGLPDLVFYADRFKNRMPSLRYETFFDLTRQDSALARLQNDFRPPAIRDVITYDSLYALIPIGQKSDFDKFRTRYPGVWGYAMVSRVGFSPDSSQALVYVTINCGILCGSGVYYLMERSDSIWTKAGWHTAFMS